MAPFSPKVFIPLTSHSPYTGSGPLLAQPPRSMSSPTLTQTDPLPQNPALPAACTIPVCVLERNTAAWLTAGGQGSAPAADSEIGFTSAAPPSLFL